MFAIFRYATNIQKHLAIRQIIRYFAPLSRNRCQEELLGMLRSNDKQFNFKGKNGFN